MSPGTDASLVARLRAAGAVILGKTNVPELCADFQTDSPLFGTTKNAWDARRTAGGSTGGGAVAVAARLSPLELGSDIGGSVRNPAHYNGIFSLKPTRMARARPRPCARPAGPDADRPLHGRLRAAGALGRGSRDWRCGSLPVPTATRPRRHRCRWGRRRASRPATFASRCSTAIRWCGSRPTPPPSCRRPPACWRKAGAKVKRAEPEGLDWQQSWDDWSDLFQYQIRALQPLAERERVLRVDRRGRSVGALGGAHGAARPGAVLRRARSPRSGRSANARPFLDDYDAWLMPVMPDAAFIRQKQSEPLAHRRRRRIRISSPARPTTTSPT